jgi:DNA-binding response OmpR family regulator
MAQHKLLIIDDDVRLGEVLKAYLDKNGHIVEHATHPDQGIKLIRSFDPDLIILDIMLPGKDGLETCREIRGFSQVPILFLSARGDTMDKIIGLEVGGDDYLSKPFEPRELQARIDSILRRAVKVNENRYGNLILNPGSLEITLDGEQIDLTGNEFQALQFLIQNRSRVVDRDDLLSFIQGLDSEVYGRSIDIMVSRIRQKLGDDPKNPTYIKTIRGQGYRFIGAS